jgi:hypothetical protein
VLDEVLTRFSLASVWDQKLETVRATPDESREGDVR